MSKRFRRRIPSLKNSRTSIGSSRNPEIFSFARSDWSARAARSSATTIISAFGASSQRRASLFTDPPRFGLWSTKIDSYGRRRARSTSGNPAGDSARTPGMLLKPTSMTSRTVASSINTKDSTFRKLPSPLSAGPRVLLKSARSILKLKRGVA